MFSDRDHWEELTQTYIKTGTAPDITPFSNVSALWDYFKFCIMTDNCFFFDHPLLDVVKAIFGEHVIALPANTTLFRTRIDTNDTLMDQAQNLMQVDILTELKEIESIPGKAEVDKMIARFTGTDDHGAYRE